MTTVPGTAKSYFLPQPSSLPLTGGCALLLAATGAAIWINAGMSGPYILAAGFALLGYMLWSWFGTVIRESEAGLYNRQVDISYRWAFGWFVFSEAMLFAAFFGALFYMRWHSIPDLASGDTAVLWPGFKGGWPATGPTIGGTLAPMHASGIPLINTLILLTSAATLTWAHWGLEKGSRSQLIVGLSVTVSLGLAFLCLQVSEYHHAYTVLQLTLGSGAYGATFFILTGFHGLHVFIGATILSVILMRSMHGDFSADDKFAFQAASWYWQFVDVIWLLLFVLVYWF
jgi:cytochrome c oxidase subunit 3